MVPEEMYYEPELTSTITIPGRGKRKFENGEVRRITRKDIAQSARDLANSQQAQDYLSGNLSLGANRSRQRLFDREFKKERERLETERLLKEAGLGGDEVVIDSGIKGDDAMKIAHTFRSRPLIGHIGGGRDQNLGDKDFLRIAPTAIGLTLGAANPVTGTLIEPLAKPLVHTGKVLLDPTKATTGIGEAAASTVDAYGAYEALRANSQLINNWVNGNFHHSDIPKFGLNALGSLPGAKYIADFIPAFGKALTWAADDVARSYNNMVNGVEPAYGIAAHTLPDPPQARNVDTNLPIARHPGLTRDIVSQLNGIGLGRYDIQGLLDRGFTPEQLLHIRNSSTPGARTNARANILAQQLLDSGINPERISRRSMLNDAANSGIQIVTNEYGYPMTIHEAQSRGIQYRPSSMDWVNTYYGYSPARHPIYDDGSAQPIFDALDNAIGVFNKHDLKQVLPEIQKVIESGYDSQKSLDDILVDLQTLFESHNKPFLSKQLETIHAASGNTFADPTWVKNSFKELLKSIDGYKSNPDIALDPYNSKTVSFVADENSLGHGYNDFHLFGTRPEDIRDWEKAIGDESLHGSYTTEHSKSLQSSSIAHHKYADRAKNGEGVIVYLTKDGRPVYAWTNGLEQSTSNPALVINSEGIPEVVQVPLHSLLRGNINQWRRMLQQTDPRALAPFGGQYPSITANFGGKKYPISFEADEAGNIMAKYDPRMIDDAKQFDAQNIARRQSLIDQYLPELQDYDGKVLSDGSTIKIINNLPVIETKQGPELIGNSYPGEWYWNLSRDDIDIVDKIRSIIFKQYDRGASPYIYQPQAGFRMFNRGGKIINSLNPTIKQLLNV